MFYWWLTVPLIEIDERCSLHLHSLVTVATRILPQRIFQKRGSNISTHQDFLVLQYSELSLGINCGMF